MHRRSYISWKSSLSCLTVEMYTMTRENRPTDRVYAPKTSLEPFRTILTLRVSAAENVL